MPAIKEYGNSFLVSLLDFSNFMDKLLRKNKEAYIMRKTTPLLLLLLVTAGASSLPAISYAASCGNLREDIKTASDYLNNSQQAKSLNDAKRMMSKAKYAINEIANDARDCPCMDAANLFDDAATKIGRASDADVAGRFNDFSKQGVELYGAGIDALNSCPESQQNPTE